ncbi:hypothetical protein [uncultured Amnibacterium sp.]|uniref:hypothetical protein n=1 Tax=uncultured Amnibacterium sp. TaxID=1631851 RepID=UPI0035CBAA91
MLTRPLGASIGDLLTQPTDAGCLGLGTAVVSDLLLAIILAGVVVFSVRRRSADRRARGARIVAEA